MSFTAVYSELREIDPEEGEELRHSPRILDRDELLQIHERTDISKSTLDDIMITDTWTDRSSYPTEEWMVLKGFKTWTPEHVLDKYDGLRQAWEDLEDSTGPLGFGYNIERMGIPYGGLESAWKEFFAAVSEHTRPFAFYHSPHEHSFPDVTGFRDGSESVYYVECVDGEVYVEEQQFERTGTEILTEGPDRVVTEGSDDE